MIACTINKIHALHSWISSYAPIVQPDKLEHWMSRHYKLQWYRILGNMGCKDHDYNLHVGYTGPLAMCSIETSQ